jgi:hypothetical protein
MQKLFCLVAILALPLSAAAQQDVPRIRQLMVQDQRERGIPLADSGHGMLSDAEAKKLPVVSNQEMSTHDMARRAEAVKLLSDGQLHTAEDFFDAALIFQHGSTPDDYLLAHVLAIDALAKDNTKRQFRNLAALTLDRYLQSTGKPQVFGTQYLSAQYSFILQHPADKTLDHDLKGIPESKQTLDPYNQTLLPDALRADFCVPPQKQQTDYITAVNSGKTEDLPNVEHCH